MNDTQIMTDAAKTIAALLDLVQGFACEAGVDALKRYSRDPIALMDEATGVLGRLKRLTAEGDEEKK